MKAVLSFAFFYADHLLYLNIWKDCMMFINDVFELIEKSNAFRVVCLK